MKSLKSYTTVASLSVAEEIDSNVSLKSRHRKRDFNEHVSFRERRLAIIDRMLYLDFSVWLNDIFDLE